MNHRFSSVMSPCAGSASLRSSGIAGYGEAEFVDGGGFARVLERVGPLWSATMRLADPLGLHRSATGLIRGTRPTMRRMLMELPIDRTYLQGALSGELPGHDALVASGVRVVTVPVPVPDAGHNIMFETLGSSYGP